MFWIITAFCLRRRSIYGNVQGHPALMTCYIHVEIPYLFASCFPSPVPRSSASSHRSATATKREKQSILSISLRCICILRALEARVSPRPNHHTDQWYLLKQKDLFTAPVHYIEQCNACIGIHVQQIEADRTHTIDTCHLNLAKWSSIRTQGTSWKLYVER